MAVALVGITVPPANIAVPPVSNVVNTKAAPKNSTVVTTNITVVPRGILPEIATHITVVSQEHSGSHPGVEKSHIAVFAVPGDFSSGWSEDTRAVVSLQTAHKKSYYEESFWFRGLY